MLPFSFHSPTRIVFGEDTAGGVCDFIHELEGKKSLIVTDGTLVAAGLISPLLAEFKGEGLVEPTVFADVPPDSDVRCVQKAAEIARRDCCDNIVAVGGGSVLDTAKVINISLSLGGDVLDYQGINNLPSKLPPLIAIPTTAGTGSEVSFVAMIKDPDDGKKILYGSRFLAPDIAILDPKLTVSLPSRLTAATGIDALTHNLEAYVAVSSGTPITDSLGLESTRLIFENLSAATADGGNIEARSAMLIASCLAGIVFTNAGVGVVHALAHAIGGHFGTHHGATNAVILPYGMEFNLDVAASRYARIARFLGISKAGTDATASRKLVGAVRKLTRTCGLATRLKDLGVPEVSEEQIRLLAETTITDPAIMFNPKEATIEDIIEIYKRAY